jgi:ferredoxin-fold anticodon binding domain-containing protein
MVDDQDTILIASDIDPEVEIESIHLNSNIIKAACTDDYTDNNITIGKYTAIKRHNIEVRDN